MTGRIGHAPGVMHQRSRLAVLLAVLALAGLVPSASAGTYPVSIAATGDSITMAFNTGSFPFVDNTAGSWATGTTTSVNSIARRASAALRYVDAKSGAKMADLAGQMDKVAAQAPAAVTILMGGNDVCTSSESTMTSVASFTSSLSAALAKVPADTRIYLASIPNVYQLWSLFKTNSTARSVWKTFGICQSMLANPTSNLQADKDRRARVVAREEAFNAALESACTNLGARCVWDGNAVYRTTFLTTDVSTRDYFHPSLAGQAKIAATTWGVWFP